MCYLVSETKDNLKSIASSLFTHQISKYFCSNNENAGKKVDNQGVHTFLLGKGGKKQASVVPVMSHFMSCGFELGVCYVILYALWNAQNSS